MTELYAVYAAGSAFSVIKASSKEEAFDIFAENQVKESNIVDFITEFASNEGLFERFYRDDEGHFIKDYFEGSSKRLQELSGQEREDYIDAWVEINVFQFWSDKPQFATEYLKERTKGYRSPDFYIPEFSHEFWIDTVKRVIQLDDWYDAFEIVKIDLINDNYQLICEPE